MVHDDLLFWGAELRDYFEGRKAALKREVERTSEEHVLQTEVEAWAEALALKFGVRAPELGEIWMEQPRESAVDVSYDHFRRAITDPSTPTYVPGYEVTFRIPFSGERDVFGLKASTYTFNPPRGTCGSGEITRTIEYPHDAPASLDSEAATFQSEVQRNLQFTLNDIETFNAELLSHALACVRFRRERIEGHRAQLQQTKVPIGPPGEREKLSIVEAIVRRPSPALDLPRKAEIELEPALAAEVFEHVLSVIRDTGLSMEKAPATFVGMNEEERRNVFLNNLNTHYRGQVSAEAFNVGGKTDLLISYENKSLFIGECKIWAGPKSLTEALDQVFSYAAWRDTKLALIFFARQKRLSALVKKARAGLADDARFKRWGEGQGETELRATMSWPGDAEREVDLEVFFCHLPE